MAIWVGYDGTLNDDDGDGPAVAGDPMAALGVGYGGYSGVYPGHVHGYPAYELPYEYVGEDDFSSALGSIGSALGSAMGGTGDGGGGGGGGGGGFDFSSLASSFGSALGGSQDGGGGGDTGSAIANIFGQVAKVAVPAATQAIAKASQSHPQGQTQQPQPQTSSSTAQSPVATAPLAPKRTAPTGTHVRQTHAIDPKAKLNLVLTHLGKKYGLTPPPSGSSGGGAGGGKTALANVGSFVQNMMGGPKQNAGTASPSASSVTSVTSGDEFVGDLGDFLEDLGSSIFHPHGHHHPYGHAYGTPLGPNVNLGVNIPWGRAQSYPAYHGYAQQGYSQYPEQPYAQQGYAQQGYAPQAHAQPLATQASPRLTRAHARPPVTYQPYPMSQQTAAKRDAGGAVPKKWSAWAMEVGPISVTHPDETKMVQVSASAPRKVGKFVSKMMGGPGSHPAMKPDEDLRNVQHTLNEYYATNVLVEDGMMGDETHRILKWFQKSNGLPETGNPDRAVMTMLSKLLSDRAISQGLQPSSSFGGGSEDMHDASADAGDWLSRGPLWNTGDMQAGSDYRTGIQSTSMYNPQSYYTDVFGAWVLPGPPEWAWPYFENEDECNW